MIFPAFMASIILSYAGLTSEPLQSLFYAARYHPHVVKGNARAKGKRDHFVCCSGCMRITVSAQSGREREERARVDAASSQVIAYVIANRRRYQYGEMALGQGVGPGTMHCPGRYQQTGVNFCLTEPKIGAVRDMPQII
jgi:hypothetical protein